MKSTIFYAVLTFLLVFFFAQDFNAQVSRYPNELRGFELFKAGKWKTLIPFVSTKADVRKIFGSECKNGCNQGKDWKVEIVYVTQYVQSPSFTPCVASELLGRVQSILLIPQKQISMKDVVFPEAFYQTETTYISHVISPITVYFDSDGLAYTVFAKELDDYLQKNGVKTDKYKSFDLKFITYRISENDAKKLADKIKCFDFRRDAIELR